MSDSETILNSSKLHVEETMRRNINNTSVSNKTEETLPLNDRVAGVQMEKIIDIKVEHDYPLRDVKPSDITLPTEDSLQQASGNEDLEIVVSHENIQLLDIDDESSSINRVLSWDPWAKLNIMKNEVNNLSIEENPQQSLQAESMGFCVTSHSAVAVPVTSILKGSPRRVSSEVANITSNPARENRLELLPIGDTVADIDSTSSRRVDKHVQWRSEVQVIYYTGDTDGGMVLSTEVEPLHEEAEQQARSVQYTRANAKNLSTIPTLENWFPQLTINK